MRDNRFSSNRVGIFGWLACQLILIYNTFHLKICIDFSFRVPSQVLKDQKLVPTNLRPLGFLSNKAAIWLKKRVSFICPATMFIPLSFMPVIYVKVHAIFRPMSVVLIFNYSEW